MISRHIWSTGALRVLLIEPPEQIPPRPLLYPPVLPRGLLITSAVLQSMGHDVRVLDLRCLNRHPSEILDLCQGFCPDVIGVSIHGVPNLLRARECLAFCRRAWPKAFLLAGGFLVKVAPGFVRAHLPPDVALFDGDSDASALSLRHFLESKDGCVHDALPAGSAEHVGTYSIPPIDYSVLLSPAGGPFAPYLTDDFELHLETQRGCPHACSYCGTFPRGAHSMLFRDPREVVDEMKAMAAQVEKLGGRSLRFWITDETFTASRSHATAFCRELLARLPGVQWRAQTRADAVDDELLDLMKRAGCYEVSFGIESLSNDVLRGVSKATDGSTGLMAMTRARKVGLKVRAILIIGLPHDSYECIRTTFRLLSDFQPDSCQIYIFHPVPGSPAFDSFVAEETVGSKHTERALRSVGFLEAPELAIAHSGHNEIVRWFVAANAGFPTSFCPIGDPAQLHRIGQGFRPSGGGLGLDRIPPGLPGPGRLAFLEVSIGSTGEFTRDEVIDRAARVSGLSPEQVANLMSARCPPRHGRELLGSAQHKDAESPKLVADVVLVRSSVGGFLCDARLDREDRTDDILRRTYALRDDAYEILLRCNGHYSVPQIAHAAACVLDDRRVTLDTVEDVLLRARRLGFVS
jgi:hypothetical protein